MFRLALVLSLLWGPSAAGEPPVQSWDEVDPPEPARPPVEVKPGPAEAPLVARDAYLGGDAILGPLVLISWVSLSAPLVGGAAAAWASQQGHPQLGGQYVRGVLAAVARVAVTTGIAILGLVAVLLLPVALTTAIGGGFFWYGYINSLVQFFNGGVTTGTGWLLFAYGGWYAGLGVGLALLALTSWVPFALANRLGVMAGDAVWDGVFVSRGVENPDERGGLLGSRVPGRRPVNVVLAGALMAAAYGGTNARTQWLEVIPLIGPWAALIARGDDGSTRMEQARALAGYERGANLRTAVRVVDVVEAVLRTVAWPLGGWAAITSVALGVGLAGVGLSILFPARLSPLLIVGMTLLGAAAVPALLTVLSMLALGAAGAWHVVAPWVLAGIGLFSAEEVPGT